MKSLYLSAACAAALSLSACMTADIDGDGVGDAPAAAATDMTPEDAATYLAMSGSSDQFEIQSS